MRKFVFIILTFSFFIACKNNESKTMKFIREYGKDTVLGPNDSTTIQWEKKFIDLGKIKRGTEVDIEFPFKNTGNKPLIIDSVIVTCGCTLFHLPDHPVLPGENGKITTKFVTELQALAHHIKHIYVKANTIHSPYHTLAFRAEVVEK